MPFINPHIFSTDGPSTTEMQMKRRQFIILMSLVLHAEMCRRRNERDKTVSEKCSWPYSSQCQNMKMTLAHLATCERKTCTSQCATIKELISHCRKCKRGDCAICVCFRVIYTREDVPGAKLPWNYSPGEVRRAYAALGFAKTVAGGTAAVDKVTLQQKDQAGVGPNVNAKLPNCSWQNFAKTVAGGTAAVDKVTLQQKGQAGAGPNVNAKPPHCSWQNLSRTEVKPTSSFYKKC